jgi:uncharacterized UPF0160 family protein
MSEIEENSSKKIYTRIGTHNGTFHCDEVVACFLLKQLPRFKDCQIIRSFFKIKLPHSC